MLIQETISELRNGFKVTMDKTRDSQEQLKPKVAAMQQANLELLTQEQALQCYLELVFNEFDVIERLEKIELAQRMTHFEQGCQQALTKAIEVGTDSKVTYYAARTHNEILDVAKIRQQISQELSGKVLLKNQQDLTDKALGELKAQLLLTITQEQKRLEELVDLRIDLMTEVSKFQETEVWLHQLDRKYTEAISQYIISPQAGCELGNLELVSNCVNQAKNDNNQLASELLAIASLYGHEDIVDYLLKQGANPKHIDSYNYSAWHRACQNGNIHILEKLLQLEKNTIKTTGKKHNGGSQSAFNLFGSKKKTQPIHNEPCSGVNLKGETDRTPVCVAVYYNQLEVVKWLEKNGADMQVVDKVGKNLLHIAAEKGHAALISPLLDAGVNPKATTKAINLSETPLLTAALADRDNSHVEVLIAFADHDYNLQSLQLQGLKPHEFEKVIKVLARVNEQRLVNMESAYYQAREAVTASKSHLSALNLQPNYF